jgi:hypothetical protein
VTGTVDDAVRSWQIYRPGQALIDPDTKENLGYEAIYLGTAALERKTTPITMRVTDSKQEIGTGDRLVAAGKPDLVDYIPRSPKTDIKGKVLSVYGGVRESGSQQIITINRGTREGMERGNVLALYSYGPVVRDRTNLLDRTTKETVKLPDERNGLVFIFRVFDKVSYGLVMSAVQPVKLGDVAQKPEAGRSSRIKGRGHPRPFFWPFSVSPSFRTPRSACPNQTPCLKPPAGCA